jgi:hypothetical protein
VKGWSYHEGFSSSGELKEENLHLKRSRIGRYLLLSLFAAIISSCRPRIAGGIIKGEPTSLNSTWLTIPLSEPVVAKWDVQLIYVEVNSSFQVSHDPLGIQLDNGSIAIPEVELVTKAGQRQIFRLVGINGKEMQFSSDQIARGSKFSELKIRSPIPLVCSQISWVSYMPQDSKYRSDRVQ